MSAGRSVPALRGLVGMVSPIVMVVAIYLVAAGHNAPGGGFIGGLVAGAALAMRGMTGDTPSRRTGQALVGVGLATAAAVGLVPALLGGVALDQATTTLALPVFGQVKAGTALLFDLGVVAVVAGLVAIVLDALAAEEVTA